MRIECLTTFLHDRDRFERGDVRTVDDALGAYFVGNGWARDEAGAGEPAQPAGDVTLAIDSTQHATEVRHG